MAQSKFCSFASMPRFDMFRFHWDNYFPRMRIPKCLVIIYKVGRNVISKKWGAKNFHRSLGRVISPQLSIYKAIYRDPRPLHSYNLNVGIAWAASRRPNSSLPFLTDSRRPNCYCTKYAHGNMSWYKETKYTKNPRFWNFDFQSCPSDEANDDYTCDLDLKTTTVQAPTLNVSASGSHARKFVGSLPSQHGSGPDDIQLANSENCRQFTWQNRNFRHIRLWKQEVLHTKEV